MDEFEFTLKETKIKTDQILGKYPPDRIRIAYSGGSDSDIVLHLMRELGYEIKAVFYDTGIEWQATKDHVAKMVERGFSIETIKAYRPIPTSNKQFGHPFINKRASDYLERLQKHNFDFQAHGALPFDVLYKMYPRCKSALQWWTSTHGEGSHYNISRHKYLREFLTEFGLPFKVSGKCCDGAKKLPMKNYCKEHGIQLVLMGVRRAEGGSRVGAYKNCFSPPGQRGYALFLPILHWSHAMKGWYQTTRNIEHSACYQTYGLKRTGCAGCPFALDFDKELTLVSNFEPKLASGITKVFSPTYEWTRRYKQYVKDRDAHNNL